MFHLLREPGNERRRDAWGSMNDEMRMDMAADWASFCRGSHGDGIMVAAKRNKACAGSPGAQAEDV